MKKVANSVLARYLAVLIAVIASSLCIISLAGILLASAVNVYDDSLDSAVANGQKNLLNLYSRYIFEEMKTNDNPGIMEDSNMEYMIVKGINPEENINSKYNTDVMNNEKNVIYSNNSFYLPEQKKTEIAADGFTNVQIFSDDEGIANQPVTLLNSFFDGGSQHSSFSSYTTYSGYVERIFYNNGIFYFETKKYAFPVKSIDVPASVLSSKDYKVLKNNYISSKKDIVTFELVTNSQGRPFYRNSDVYNLVLDTDGYNKWKTICLNGIEFLPKTIKAGNVSDGTELFKNNDYECYLENADFYDTRIEASEYNSVKYLNINISYKINDTSYSNIYAIFSNSILEAVGSKEDLFMVQKKIITFLYKMRYVMIAVSVVSIIVFLVMLIFACYSKYASSDNEMVRKNIIHKMPFSIYLFIVGGTLVLDIACGIAVAAENWMYIEDSSFLLFICLLAVLWIMSCIFLSIIILLETSCRAGAHILFRNTFIYYIYSAVKKSFSSVKNTFSKINNNISLFTNTIIGLIAINIFILMHLLLVNGMYFDSGLHMFFMLVDTCICAVFDFLVLKIVLQMESLQKHAKKMADGSLESKADTSKMIQPLKKHGEYLNKIGEGMSIAVNEKIKSEHFKTELITNVSHDIKTPLTSIINYVDLLKKENLPEPKAQEYIEVLDRQSSRLKKLIEDLMEASKASTGNITVELELCDINILLTQTLGEFEEKLSSKGLEFVINKPDESIYIMADNRHIWRIFDNLMNNICKYGQSGTRVYINLELKNKKAVIVFRNTSNYQLNISSDELLERFVRGDSSRHTEGSGLGLSIAQNLAELMGGSLKLQVDGDLFKVVLSFPQTDAPQTDDTEADDIGKAGTGN